jgi:hypothetical protein
MTCITETREQMSSGLFYIGTSKEKWTHQAGIGRITTGLKRAVQTVPPIFWLHPRTTPSTICLLYIWNTQKPSHYHNGSASKQPCIQLVIKGVIHCSICWPEGFFFPKEHLLLWGNNWEKRSAAANSWSFLNNHKLKFCGHRAVIPGSQGWAPWSFSHGPHKENGKEGYISRLPFHHAPSISQKPCLRCHELRSITAEVNPLCTLLPCWPFSTCTVTTVPH